MMDWHTRLEAGEQLRWSGRPAPRCFTFRRWIHSLFGLLLLPLAWVWLDGGRALAQSRGEMVWAVIPWLGIAVALYFLCGHLMLARLAWEKTFYAITDRRVLATGGWPRARQTEMRLEDLRHLKLIPRGEQLGSLVIRGTEQGAVLVFACLEHPGKAIELLEARVRANVHGAGAP